MAAGSKFCPNCGAELAPGAKFCTTCGYNMEQATNGTPSPNQGPTQPSAPQSTQQQPMRSAQPTFEAAQAYSKNYFMWFVDTLLHPNQSQDGTQRYFGLISLVITPLLLTLTLAMTGNRLWQQFGTHLSSFFNTRPQQTSMFDFGSGFKIFIWLLLFEALYVGVAYGAGIVANNNQRLNFWGFTNRFAALTNSMLVTALLVFLTSFTINYNSQMTTFMSFVSDFYLPLFLLCLTSMIFQIGFIMAILPSPAVVSRIGLTYIVLAAQLIVSVVVYLVINGQIWHWIDAIKALGQSM